MKSEIDMSRSVSEKCSLEPLYAVHAINRDTNTLIESKFKEVPDKFSHEILGSLLREKKVNEERIKLILSSSDERIRLIRDFDAGFSKKVSDAQKQGKDISQILRNWLQHTYNFPKDEEDVVNYVRTYEAARAGKTQIAYMNSILGVNIRADMKVIYGDTSMTYINAFKSVNSEVTSILLKKMKSECSV